MVAGSPSTSPPAKTIKLGLPAGFVENQAIFEDTTDVIVLGSVPSKTSAQTMYRCRVTTGECKVLPTNKPDGILALAKP